MSDALPRILVVDDEPENLKALERTLRGDFDVVAESDPARALELVLDGDFEVIVSDQRMPAMRGTELLARVAQAKPLVTRVILTAFTEGREMLDAINRAEIYRYITKPWDNAELKAAVKQAVEYHRLRAQNQELLRTLEQKVAERTEELKRANERLSELAMTDPLTRVLNRRAFFAKFDEEIERSRRYRHPISVVMLDVDHFKSFNDMEGHPLGDEALKKIAGIIKSRIRKIDLVCRYGGEEFCILMPETAQTTAGEICERLRGAVETVSFQGHDGPAYLTISIGLAGYPEDGSTRKDLIAAADEALYAAKRSGRNRVVAKHDEASFFVS